MGSNRIRIKDLAPICPNQQHVATVSSTSQSVLETKLSWIWDKWKTQPQIDFWTARPSLLQGAVTSCTVQHLGREPQTRLRNHGCRACIGPAKKFGTASQSENHFLWSRARKCTAYQNVLKEYKYTGHRPPHWHDSCKTESYRIYRSDTSASSRFEPSTFSKLKQRSIGTLPGGGPRQQNNPSLQLWRSRVVPHVVARKCLCAAPAKNQLSWRLLIDSATWWNQL